MIKLELDYNKIAFAKELIVNSIIDLKSYKGLSTIEVLIDVDPN
jgi:hypothetical protein